MHAGAVCALYSKQCREDAERTKLERASSFSPSRHVTSRSVFFRACVLYWRFLVGGLTLGVCCEGRIVKGACWLCFGGVCGLRFVWLLFGCLESVVR